MIETPVPHRADWMKEAGWGVCVHFLAGRVDDPSSHIISPDSWNRRVDEFDVAGISRHLADCGAGYCMITIGQNSGHYCAPNAAYAELVGASDKLSRRDLITDMARALKRHNIPLLAYIPSGAPCADKHACARLEYDNTIPEKYAFNDPKVPRQTAFQLKWQMVLQEWSLRWGDLVRGWWVDGCYYSQAMYLPDDEPNFHSLAAALRAGRADACLAFNSGTALHYKRISVEEDYIAGETAECLPIGGFYGTGFTPLPEKIDGAQLHFLNFLGTLWGQGLPRLPDILAASYTRYIRDRGGAITWDVPITADGKLHAAFLRQLEAIGKQQLNKEGQLCNV